MTMHSPWARSISSTLESAIFCSQTAVFGTYCLKKMKSKSCVYFGEDEATYSNSSSEFIGIELKSDEVDTHFREAEYLVDTELLNPSLLICDTQKKIFTRGSRFSGYYVTVEAPRDFKYIHICSFFGHFTAVELLLNQDTKINSRDECNRTPIHHAAKDGI